MSECSKDMNFVNFKFYYTGSQTCVFVVHDDELKDRLSIGPEPEFPFSEINQPTRRRWLGSHSLFDHHHHPLRPPSPPPPLVATPPHPSPHLHTPGRHPNTPGPHRRTTTHQQRTVGRRQPPAPPSQNPQVAQRGGNGRRRERARCVGTKWVKEENAADPTRRARTRARTRRSRQRAGRRRLSERRSGVWWAKGEGWVE
ncbi:hypothetical protein D9613_008232 [Agrocybe pediades]|uniref:Uncharacterized protein n=1 Tax=Agrocybe pediades TaxID=84607 RepID=A0A8H4QUX9_9AGAR|nr:hypothetical protein D9613_008232 [Agrocybe pediades]